MHGGPTKVLRVSGAPARLGTIHGGELGEPIRRYLGQRLGLSADSTWSGRNVDPELVLSLAETTLPHHRRYSEDLYLEMEALARAAGVTPAEAVVVGGFTDLIDVVRSHVGMAPVEDDCTAVIDPVGGRLAQTWDMHASAGEYVLVLDLQPASGPRALIQTTAGCLGQIGMNEAGVAVGINNLTAMGKPGVTWPFVVRKALQQTNLDAAVECVLSADLAGGHNYLLLGPEGEGVNIEAMPHSVRVTGVGETPFVHTNHCLGPETVAEEGERSAEQTDSSRARLDRGGKLAGDLEAFFSEPVIIRHALQPHDVATCGAVIMEPARRRFQTVWGVPGDRPWETFQI